MQIKDLPSSSTLASTDVLAKDTNDGTTQKITGQDLAGQIKSLGNLLGTSDVVNNLTSGGTTVPLSAEMGKTLAAKSIDTSGSGYCKFADGTLICWGIYTGNSIAATQVGSLYYALSINVNITFPVAFNAKPAITLSPASTTYNIISEVSSDAAGIGSVSIARPNSGNVTPSFSWIAIGRWKA